MIATQSVWARGRGGPAVPSLSTTTISYQGRLADSDGEPLTGSYDMVFRLYDAPVGGAAVWVESWTGGDAVAAAEGLFHVMLGSLNPDLAAVVNTYDELYLGITVGADAEMTPRVQLGSVPFALQAMTVAADSITAAEIVDGVIGTNELADSAVTSAKMDAVDAYSYVSAQESTTSTTWASLPTPDEVSISLTNNQWVIIHFGATAGVNVGFPAYMGISIDGQPVDGSRFIETWTQTMSMSGFARVQLDPGSHTITAQYQTQQGGTATFWNRRLLVFSISQ